MLDLLELGSGPWSNNVKLGRICIRSLLEVSTNYSPFQKNYTTMKRWWEIKSSNNFNGQPAQVALRPRKKSSRLRYTCKCHEHVLQC